MRPVRPTIVLALAVAGVILLSPTTHAGLIDLIYSQPIGNHWGQAVTGSNYFWSDHLVPSAGNDYEVGNAAGKTLRTPETTNSTFAGDSLTVNPTGQLLLKANSSTRVFTVSDFRFNGGSLTHGSDNQTITFDGLATVLTNSTISNAGVNARRLYFDADLIGNAKLTVNLGDDDWVRVRGDNRGFSGDWDILFTPASGDDGSPTPNFDAQTPNSLGSGNIRVGPKILFDADFDIANWGGSFTLDGIMQLDQNHLFGDLIIGGTELPAGVYTFNQLNTRFDPYFLNGGTGTIRVVPEPATLALGLLALLGIRRRLSRRR